MSSRFPILPALLVLSLFLSSPNYLAAQKATSQRKNRPAVLAKGSQRREAALAAVASAVHMSSKLSPELRGFLLAEAGMAVAGVEPAKAVQYCTLAFDTAEEMALLDPYDLRIGVQEGVVANMVRLDPEKAADLLMQADRPQWTGYPDDDPRSRSALLLVGRLLQSGGDKNLQKIKELLDYLGATGKYPYRAASLVIQFLGKHQRRGDAAAVFQSAVAYFDKDSQFPTSPDEFADLIVSNAAALPGSALVPAIRAVVDKAEKAEQNAASSDAPPHRRFMLSTSNGTIPVSKKSTYLALRLLPLAKKLSSDLADDLEQHDPALNSMVKDLSPEQLTTLSQGRLAVLNSDSDPSSSQMQGFAEKVNDQRVLQKIRTMGNDSKGAISLAETLNSSGPRIQALAEIARSLSESDPARAASLLDEAESSLEKVEDKQEAVQAVLPIASAWAGIADRNKALAALSRGYSLTTALYQKEEESGATDEDLLLGPSARLFRRLVQTEAEIDSAGTIGRVQSRVGSIPLRAVMLIDAAKVILEKHT